MPISLLYVKIMTEIRETSLAIVSLIAFLAGIGVDRLYLATQKVHPVTSYTMHVLKKIDSYNYWVQEIDPVSKQPIAGQAGRAYLWKECEEPHADLDPGMSVDVTVELLSCGNSFADQERTGWTVDRYPGTAKFIDFREERK
jgi:hypothetical protein